MMPSISHSFESETPESKARWFQSLTMDDRARIFCEYYNLAKSLNPNLAEKKNARSAQTGVLILRKT